MSEATHEPTSPPGFTFGPSALVTPANAVTVARLLAAPVYVLMLVAWGASWINVVVGLVLYLALPAYEPWYPVVLPVFGFFVFGVFSGYAVYLPELFPTHIRSTAVGFCTGSARIITSFGPLVAGLLVGAFGGSFNRVTAFMTCFALLSILAMLLGRETKGNPLPR